MDHAAYERICDVLHRYMERCPAPEGSEQDQRDRAADREKRQIEEFDRELNPTRDKVKLKIHKIEGVWDWLDRVSTCLRCQEELRMTEARWARRYWTRPEKQDFFGFYQMGSVRPKLDQAIMKLDRLFERRGVY